MGGKRPDQHNIDPAEGSSSDHKWRGEGRSGDERIENEQKQELQSNPKDQPMIPESGTNPALRDLRDKKVRQAQEAEADREEKIAQASEPEAKRRRRDEAENDEEARLDETIEESFPASDPPQQP